MSLICNLYNYLLSNQSMYLLELTYTLIDKAHILTALLTRIMSNIVQYNQNKYLNPLLESLIHTQCIHLLCLISIQHSLIWNMPSTNLIAQYIPHCILSKPPVFPRHRLYSYRPHICCMFYHLSE